MKRLNFRLPVRPLALAWALSTAFSGAALAAEHEHGKLGFGLRDLVEFSARPAGRNQAASTLRQRLDAGFSQSRLVVLDAQDRVQVKLTLDGSQGLAAVQAQIEAMGGRVNAVNSRYRRGVASAHVPVGALTQLAAAPGVRAVMLAPPPVTEVGLTTSQGAPLLKTDQLNAAGITGAGITVGVMSDSYDTSSSTIRAANDVGSGDLPGIGNPLGHTQPVVVVRDQPARSDEGRAMAQIVHDLAPGARLCFATAYATEVEFANNIRALADPAGLCKAQVIVDDIIYFTEPFFSDGVVAQAVDEVAAAGVAYFSSAGNRSSGHGYQAEFRGVSRVNALGVPQTVDLSLIPAAASEGGFHNFNRGLGPDDVSKTITLAADSNTLVFQWNDPFDAGGVTTDYDVYVFNQAGTALVAVWNDDNFATDEPIEGGALAAGTYQIVIARRGAESVPPRASRIRYVAFGTVLRTEYPDYSTPVTFGHNSAKGAIGTAAYPWYAPYAPERFTSPGPVTMYFDAEGRRLFEPEVRQKPDIAAPDGVNTTFFISDSAEDADSFPNFFGTSASAPHAAAVAALMLQRAGGPGTLSPAQIRQFLQQTAKVHNLQPGVVDATAMAGAAKVVVTADGNPDYVNQFNPEFFKVSMLAPAGYTLQNLTLDLSTANAERVRLGVAAPGLQFDPRPINAGFPLTLGTLRNLTAADVSFSPLATAAPFSRTLTLSFAPGRFGNKSSMTFGVDRDEVATNSTVQKSADMLIGGRVTGSVLPPGGGAAIPFSATFQARQVTKGYSPLDGYGMIDALDAVSAVPTPTKRR